MARAIDADSLLEELKQIANEMGRISIHISDMVKVMTKCVERQPTLTPPNEPLTIERLREMDGEPVWVELYQAWALVEVKQNGSVMFYGNSFSCSYSRTWQVYRFRPYRRLPEGESDA